MSETVGTVAPPKVTEGSRQALVGEVCRAFGSPKGGRNPLSFGKAELAEALGTGVPPPGWHDAPSDGVRTVHAEPKREEGAADVRQLAALRKRIEALERAQGRSGGATEDAAPEGPVLRHRMLPRLIEELGYGNHVLLTGGAGSGKTHAAEQAAAALGIGFVAQSFCAQTTKSDMLGFVHAGGQAVRTPLQDACERGLLFLGDEMDAGSANVTLGLNAATSNTFAAFASGMVKVAKPFRCVATANTTGHGSSVVYVGRNQLDGATLDRFVTLHWEYDTELEVARLVRKGDPGTVEEWVRAVQKLRAALDSIPATSRPRTVLGRNAAQGAPFVRAGGKIAEALDRYVWAKMSGDARAAIEAASR